MCKQLVNLTAGGPKIHVTQIHAPLSLILSALIILGASSCDKYNIVEPRFYSKDDINEIPLCDAQSPSASSHTNEVCIIVDTIDVLPSAFSLDICWLDKKSEYLVFILICLSRLTLSLLL